MNNLAEILESVTNLGETICA